MGNMLELISIKMILIESILLGIWATLFMDFLAKIPLKFADWILGPPFEKEIPLLESLSVPRAP